MATLATWKTLKDKCKIDKIGMSEDAFRVLCEETNIKPKEGGKGSGSHRKFSLMQAVGIMVVAKLRNSERGCNLPYAEKVIQAFEAVDREWLEKQLRKSGKCFFGVHQGKPLFASATSMFDDAVNVEEIYETVLKALGE